MRINLTLIVLCGLFASNSATSQSDSKLILESASIEKSNKFYITAEKYKTTIEDCAVEVEAHYFTVYTKARINERNQKWVSKFKLSDIDFVVPYLGRETKLAIQLKDNSSVDYRCIVWDGVNTGKRCGVPEPGYAGAFIFSSKENRKEFIERLNSAEKRCGNIKVLQPAKFQNSNDIPILRTDFDNFVGGGWRSDPDLGAMAKRALELSNQREAREKAGNDQQTGTERWTCTTDCEGVIMYNPGKASVTIYANDYSSATRTAERQLKLQCSRMPSHPNGSGNARSRAIFCSR